MQPQMIQGLYGKQIQSQKMSVQQIMTMKMLSLKSMDLREEILKEVENNPALEIKFDPLSSNTQEGVPYSQKTQTDSDKFQAMLENQEDSRKTLYQHLTEQLNMQKMSDEEFEACSKLIDNLDNKGFHILAPDSLKNSLGKRFSPVILKKAMDIIHHFEPSGICVKNFEESLKIQAEIKMEEENIPPSKNKLILFILNGRFNFLDPPEIPKIQEKILLWKKENDLLQIKNSDQKNSIPEYEIFDKKYVSEERILNALNFIKTLNPFPAANFSSSAQQNFIEPDVKVTIEKGSIEKDNLENGEIFYSKEEFLKVSPVNNFLPEVGLSKEFKDSLKSKKITSSTVKDMIREKIRSANSFISTLNFRNKVIFDTLVKIISIQKEFFKKGQGNLVPLTQKDLAQIQKISESTVSRLSDSKYILCDWGLYPMKNFFSHSIHKGSNISSEKVKMKILEIVNQNSATRKKFSDQKISEILKTQGFEISRRTVAKYRSQLNISSSFKR